MNKESGIAEESKLRGYRVVCDSDVWFIQKMRGRIAYAVNVAGKPARLELVGGRWSDLKKLKMWVKVRFRVL